MKRQALSRREMLIGGAMSPLWLANAQAPPERGQLSSNWPFEKLGPALLPREQWRPFPPAADRAAWEKLPATEREEWIRAAEAHLGAAWPPLPATVFLEFQRTGNRTGYQRIRDQRRHRLEELVLGECAEGKGRFMDEIVNGVWATCEETFWGVPAHLGAQRAGVGLPDVSEPVVDLFAAETASLLAWTDYLLGPRLEEVSPLLRPRIHAEIDRRILTPCLHREAFGWMGFHSDRPVNNWNPWINSNWLTATLLLEPNPRRRTASVHKILRSVDRFLDGYHEDGGCDEGPSYWTRAGGSLFDCLELLYSASEGRIDFYRLPLIGEIGRYVWRAHIFEDWFVNFADAPARVRLPGDLVFRYGRRIGDAPLQMLGAWAGRSGGGREGSIGRTLHAIFNRETLRQAPAGQPLARDAWMPGIQVMTARVREGSAEGLYLAAQGGHNAESHNHNDVGNFIVYANGAARAHRCRRRDVHRENLRTEPLRHLDHAVGLSQPADHRRRDAGARTPRRGAQRLVPRGHRSRGIPPRHRGRLSAGGGPAVVVAHPAPGPQAERDPAAGTIHARAHPQRDHLDVHDPLPAPDRNRPGAAQRRVPQGHAGYAELSGADVPGIGGRDSA
jgi:hypothetical protein